MSSNHKNRVCPVEHAGILDFSLRKLFHNPMKILKPYAGGGMTVLDLGCGPGFFTIEMAKMVGSSGRVIAADLQEGMLEKVRKKTAGTSLQDIVKLHKCPEGGIGLSEKLDFILLFYMVHEIPDKSAFFRELKALLKPTGKILMVEPKFHVTKSDFDGSKALIKTIGFDVIEGPGIFFSRSIVLRPAGK